MHCDLILSTERWAPLELALSTSERGAGSRLLLEGPYGAGKSHILTHLKATAAQRGFGLPPPGDESLPDRLRTWLRQRDSAVPALVALDDVHKLDESAARGLSTLVTRHPEAVAWAFTRRTGHGGAEVERMFSLPPGVPALTDTRVTLRPLPDSAVTELAVALLGAPLSAELATLGASTGGNPRLAVELFHGLREEGAVTLESGVARLTSSVLPERVYRVARLVLAEVSPGCRRFIQVAAVCGLRFGLDEVAALLAQPTGTLLPLAEEAIHAGVVTFTTDRLSFTQELLWRALSAALPEPIHTALRHDVSRIRSGTDEVDWPASLSEIDRVIADLVRHGLTNSQIATRVNRSPHTVSYHLRKMFGKLGVHSRTELASAVTQRMRESR